MSGTLLLYVPPISLHIHRATHTGKCAIRDQDVLQNITLLFYFLFASGLRHLSFLFFPPIDTNNSNMDASKETNMPG